MFVQVRAECQIYLNTMPNAAEHALTNEKETDASEKPKSTEQKGQTTIKHKYEFIEHLYNKCLKKTTSA